MKLELDKYEIEEMYSQLVEEIVKVIHEEYEVEEVINEFEDEDFEDILSNYDYDKWIVAMYFLDDPEDIEEEGWDSILEQFIDDIRESFIDKYENEEENYIKIEDMGKLNTASSKQQIKINPDVTNKEFKKFLKLYESEINIARKLNDLKRISKYQLKLDGLVDDVIESYVADRDKWMKNSYNFSQLKIYYVNNYVDVLKEEIYGFEDITDRNYVQGLIDLMDKEITNY